MVQKLVKLQNARSDTSGRFYAGNRVFAFLSAVGYLFKVIVSVTFFVRADVQCFAHRLLNTVEILFVQLIYGTQKSIADGLFASKSG